METIVSPEISAECERRSITFIRSCGRNITRKRREEIENMAEHGMYAQHEAGTILGNGGFIYGPLRDECQDPRHDPRAER